MILHQIETEALRLPMRDRAALTQRLLLSLEEISDADYDQLWVEEALRRAAKFDAGNSVAISGEEVAKKARALLR
jgi:putative addiction module component (TIGR02574 family)